MKKLLYLFYFAGIFLVACYSYRKPDYNFDMLPYIALVAKIDHKDINIIHQIAYRSARENVPPETYRRLTDSLNPYRKKMQEDAAFFYGQLPFYMIKPFYTTLVYLFFKTGISLPRATVLPSILAYLLTGLLLLYWLEKYLSSNASVLLGLFALLSPPFLAVARMSTPDALSALFLFAAFYFILEKPKRAPLFIMLTLSLFVRLDNGIACFCLLTLLAFSPGKRKIPLWQYLSMMTTLALCYFVIILPTRSFGWSPFFYPSFRAADPHYTHGIGALAEGMYYSHFLLLIFSLILLLLPFPLFRDDHLPAAPLLSEPLLSDRLLTGTLLGILLIRFLLYPDPADRYYIAFFLATLMLIVRRLWYARTLTIGRKNIIGSPTSNVIP